MKVLILADNLLVGGVNRYCLSLAKGLTDAGVDCRLAALGDREDDFLIRQAAAQGVTLTIIPYRPRPQTVHRVAQLVKAIGPNIVHTQGYRSSIVGRLAVRGWRLPVTIVTTVHGIAANVTPLVHFYNTIDDWTAGWTDRFIAVSNDTKRRLLAKGYSNEKVSIVLNGTPGLGTTACPADQGPVLGYIGRLSWEKGVRRLPELFRGIRVQVPTAQLLLIGDGPERSYLEQSFPPTDRNAVTFLGVRDDVGALHERLRALILPSLTEGLPLVAVEAMAAGLPVVATNVGGLPETVTHGQTGFLSGRDDLEGLIRNSVNLLRDPVLAGRMGVAARLDYAQRFTVEQMVRGTLGVYFEVSQVRT